MLELPELTPEHFEILVTRELRKVGLLVSEVRIHRREPLPEPEPWGCRPSAVRAVLAQPSTTAMLSALLKLFFIHPP